MFGYKNRKSSNHIPFISVVIPTHCRQQSLERAVTSILNQTFTDWELVISDDEEKAGPTWQYLMDLASRDVRVRPVRNQSDQGQSGNTNYGMSKARAPWIKLLHDDDYLTPDCLEVYAQTARAMPTEVVLITADVVERKRAVAAGSATKAWPSEARLFTGKQALHRMYLQENVGGTVPSSMLIRRVLVLQGIKFETHDNLPTAVDSLFKARLLVHGDLAHLNTILVIKGQNDSFSITNTMTRKSLDRELLYLRELVEPMLDKSLRPPALEVVQGQVTLIRGFHRFAKGHIKEGIEKLLSVRHPHSWLLAFKWLFRYTFPLTDSQVKSIPLNISLKKQSKQT